MPLVAPVIAITCSLIFLNFMIAVFLYDFVIAFTFIFTFAFSIFSLNLLP